MAAVVGHAGGAWGGDPQTGYSSSCLPANPCAHLTVRLPHGTQRPLSAGNYSPTSQIWVCWIHTGWMWVRAHTQPSPEDKKPGVGCSLEPTTDTKSSSTLRELEAVGATTFSQCSSSTKSASFRELRLRAYTLPASLAESCGVRAWAAERASFLQEPPHLAIWVTDEGPQSSVSYFQDLQGLQREEGATWRHVGGVIS